MNRIQLPNNYRYQNPSKTRRAPAFNRIRDREVILPRKHIGLGNWFRVEIEKPGIGTRFMSPWFHNHITDQGLDLCATTPNRYNACQVGSGNAAPTDADTGLQNYTAGTSSKTDFGDSYNNTVLPYYGESYLRYNFPLGAFNDDILSEVMIGTHTSGGSCFSRELIRDAVGAPTTIQVASDEILRVHYKIRHYPPLDDVVGTLSLDIYETPTNFDYIRRTLAFPDRWEPSGNVAQNSADTFNPTGFNSGTVTRLRDAPIQSISYNNFAGTSATSVTPQSYSAGSFSRMTECLWNTAKGTFNASLFLWSTRYGVISFQHAFYPTIEKTNQDNLILNVQTSWGRYEEPSV